MTKVEQFYEAKNKLAQYNQETRRLMDVAKQFQDIDTEKFTLSEIVSLLRNSFKERLTHATVLGEKEMRENTDPSSGFCMTASYLIYLLTGGDKVWELRGTNLHWWLYHKKSNTVFDITNTQFPVDDIKQIYKLGRPVAELKTDDKFNEMLKIQARTLAHRAGIE